MRKILCALSLFCCFSSDAILTIDGYKQYISNFRSDTDLLKGYILSDVKEILEKHRLYGNFKSGIRGRHNGKDLSYQDQGNDDMTRLVIQLFPSVGGFLNAEGTGSFSSLIALANEQFSEIDLIVGMFQLAQDIRSQMKEIDLDTDIDEETTKNLRELITNTKNSLSKFSAEECLRCIDLLRNDPKIEQNKKNQIEKRIWKSVENQLKDNSINWSLKCLKILSDCKDKDIKANIQNKIMRKLVSHYFGTIQNKNLFSALLKLIGNMFGSINSENINFKGKIDQKKYPQNYTNYVISAYAWTILNNNQLKTFSEKLQQRLGYKGRSYANQLVEVLEQNANCFPFGNGRILDYGIAFFQDAFFMDCLENILKQFFAMLLYSINDESIDDRLPNTEIGAKIRKFFSGGRKNVQQQALSNTNRSEWVNIISNIPNITYLKEKNGLKYEIDSGWSYFLEAICVLLEGYSAGNNDGSRIYKRKYKAQKTIEYINQSLKNSKNETLEYINNNVEKILNNILGIRTDVKLSAQKITDTDCHISANRWDTEKKSKDLVILKITSLHTTLKNKKKNLEISNISENEWIDSLLVNIHKATKNYKPIDKFVSAKHKHSKHKIFPATLAQRFYSNKNKTKDLIEALEDYSKQEQIEVIKSIYNHAEIRRFLDLFYNSKGIIKEILNKISKQELEGKTLDEVLLRYYVSEDSINAFDDILKKSIQTKNVSRVKNFFEMASRIYLNMDLLLEKEGNESRPISQPKGSEALLDFMLFVIENISDKDLKMIRDQLVETLDLFDIDHLIGTQKLQNLVQKIQNLWKPEEKTYCLNEFLKRSIEKIRLMSHLAQLTYDGAYFLNTEDESLTILQAKNLCVLNYYEDIFECIEDQNELVDNLPIILTNALKIYNINEPTIMAQIDYNRPLKLIKNIGNKYLPRISVEKAKQWIDIHPILIYLFNEKNTDVVKVFDYFLEQIENRKIPIDHISWFSSFLKFARKSISDEQIKRLLDMLSSHVSILIKRSEFKSFCEDLFDACINTEKRGILMLKFLSTYCGEVGLNVLDNKFLEVLNQQQKGIGKNYTDEEKSEYLKIIND